MQGYAIRCEPRLCSAHSHRYSDGSACATQLSASLEACGTDSLDEFYLHQPGKHLTVGWGGMLVGWLPHGLPD